MIGDSLKNNFPGYEAWMISSSKDGLKSVGLRPAEKMTLFNGALECSYRCYQLYQGSKKSTKRD